MGVAADVDPAVADALKKWRLGEAQRRKIPAYRIFPNRTLDALARAKPCNSRELLAVHGVGPKLVEGYGSDILGLLRDGGWSRNW